MFPAFQPRPKVTDSAPLVALPSLEPPIPIAQSAPTTSMVVSLLMLAAAGSLYWVSRPRLGVQR